MIAAARESWRTPIPAIVNNSTSKKIQRLWPAISPKIPVTAAMNRQAYIALRVAVTAATSSSIFGQKSSRMRDVGLGVEGERPRVSMEVQDTKGIDIRNT